MENENESKEFMDWSEEDPGDTPAADYGWIETKVLMRNVGAQATPGTVGVEDLNQELAALRSRGWEYQHIEVIRSTETSFAVVFVMERLNQPE